MRRLGRNGITRPEELIQALGLDQPGCCGRCLKSMHRFVATARSHEADRLPVLDTQG